MSLGLRRYHDTGHLHFVTFSCVRKRQILGTGAARDCLLGILEETREKYCFAVHGYVVMPDHVHLLVSEPAVRPLSVAMQVVKQRFSRTRAEQFVWESRYYDFNVYTQEKQVEKLRYIHRNPVRRGLVERPEDWGWSSFRFYWLGEVGIVTVTDGVEDGRLLPQTIPHPFAVRLARGWGNRFL